MRHETVTEYVACDGTRFKDKERCLAYEDEFHAVEPIMARLPKTDLEHGTYVQHDRETLLQVKRDL